MDIPLWGSFYTILMSTAWEFESKVNELFTFAHKSPHPSATSYIINQSPVLIISDHDYNQIPRMWPRGNADYPASFHTVLGDFQPEALGGFWTVSVRCLLYCVLCSSSRENQRQFSTLKYAIHIIWLMGAAWNFPKRCYEILVLLLLFLPSLKFSWMINN